VRYTSCAGWVPPIPSEVWHYEDSRPPPRRISALPLVVAAVLSLALASAADALTVEIIEPPTDPFDVIAGQSYDFEAVAYDNGQQLPPQQVNWEWDFGDGSDPDTDNPTEHTFTATGQYLVTVTAEYGGISAGAETTANVLPTFAADWDFFVRPDESEELRFGSEVCDEIDLVFRTTDMGLIFIARFWTRNPDGSWSAVGNGEFMSPEVHQPPEGWYQEVDSDAIDTTMAPNRVTMYQVEIQVEVGGEGGPFWLPYLRHRQVSSNNTAVHEADDGILLHAQTSQHHQIGWTIAHRDPCAYLDPMGPDQWVAPTFGVSAEIFALGGSEPLVTLYESGVGLGSGSLEWDGTIPGEGPAPVGVYSYQVTADHAQTPAACEEQDKSPRLIIDDVRTTDQGVSLVEFFPREQRMEYEVFYRLSRDAAPDSVWLKVYKRHLELVHVAAADNTAGVRSVTGEFSTDPGVTGEYYFVISAVETQADALLNRDGWAKLARPSGATHCELPRASLYRDADDCYWPDGLDAVVSRSYDRTNYVAAMHNNYPGVASFVKESWERDAIFHVVGHGRGGAACTYYPAQPPHGYLVEKKWDEPGTIGRPFSYNLDVAGDQVEGDYPNLLLVVLQACYTAVEAEDIGSAIKGANRAGADVALGFQDLILLDGPAATWVQYFYQNAIDPLNPQRTVEQAAEYAEQWVEYVWGDTPVNEPGWPYPTVGKGGYDERQYAPTNGGASLQLLDGGAHWGS